VLRNVSILAGPTLVGVAAGVALFGDSSELWNLVWNGRQYNREFRQLRNELYHSWFSSLFKQVKTKLRLKSLLAAALVCLLLSTVWSFSPSQHSPLPRYFRCRHYQSLHNYPRPISHLDRRLQAVLQLSVSSACTTQSFSSSAPTPATLWASVAAPSFSISPRPSLVWKTPASSTAGGFLTCLAAAPDTSRTLTLSRSLLLFLLLLSDVRFRAAPFPSASSALGIPLTALAVWVFLKPWPALTSASFIQPVRGWLDWRIHPRSAESCFCLGSAPVFCLRLPHTEAPLTAAVQPSVSNPLLKTSCGLEAGFLSTHSKLFGAQLLY
jgi:hypothetical protein